MFNILKHITIFFALLFGVLSNGFANATVLDCVSDMRRDGSKISIEKSAVGCDVIKAWEKAILRPHYRADVNFLQKLTELMEPNVVNKFPNGQADIDAIIAALVHPHTGATHTFMKNVADHLDDIKHLVVNHRVPGYEKVITELKKLNSFNAQDGASHLLTKLKQYNAGQVKRLESKILDADDLDNIDDLCTDCLFDIELDGNPVVKLELKSFGETAIGLMPINSKFKNQFKAYLASVSDMNGFKYVFNGKKTQNLTLIKQKFQTIFTNEAQSIYNALGESKFNQLFGVNNVTDFLEDILIGIWIDHLDCVDKMANIKAENTD